MHQPDFLQPIPKTKYHHGPYRGLVEQRCDPARLLRLRVRVAGVHAPDAPVETLPWAYPQRDLSDHAGEMGAPPIGTWVWVDFEGGDHEYPRWTGSAWGENQAINGLGVSAHRNWSTSAFGGGWQDGPLKMEQVDEAKPEDAPNNFGYVTPLQKRLELDDRHNRQRIVLADASDNMLFMNSEQASITLEAAVGVRASNMIRPRGLTLSSDPSIQATQLYSHRGWLLTMRDIDAVCSFEISSPSGHIFRINDRIGSHRIDMWTRGGHRLVMDDTDGYCWLESAAGYGVILNDADKSSTYYAPNRSMYVHMDPGDGFMEVFSSGTLRLKAAEDLDIQSTGDIHIDGKQIFLNSKKRPNAKASAPRGKVRLMPPDKQKKVLRACDYKYFMKPE